MAENHRPTTPSPLVRALLERERAYRDAVHRLRDVANQDAHDLGEAIELVGCLRRLLAGRSVDEIHRAFGAPGDFGYETPIGDALYRTYFGSLAS